MDNSKTFSEIQAFYFDYFLGAIQKFSTENPFLLVTVCLLLAFILEISLPKRIEYDRVKRKGFVIDLFYFFIYDFVIFFLGLYAVTYVLNNLFYSIIGGLGLDKASLQIFDIHGLHIVFQIIILFVIVDFFEWFAHFLMHRFDFLWAFHKIHHAQEEIGVSSSRHFHILEFFVFKPIVFLPVSLIGYTTSEYAIYTSFFIVFVAFFTHANAKIPLGKLNLLINSPNTHIWHHAQNVPEKFRYGVNFASVLNIWDVLLGYYYLPDDSKNPQLGIWDMEEVPKTIWGQFFYPFKYLFTKKWTSNRFDVIPKEFIKLKKRAKKKASKKAQK